MRCPQCGHEGPEQDFVTCTDFDFECPECNHTFNLRQEDGGSVNALGSAPNGRLLRKANRTAREVLEVCHAMVRGGIK